jgi:hypothetical protein
MKHIFTRAAFIAFLPFVVVLWGMAAQAQGTPSGMLDGKSFAGDIGDKGKPAVGKEVMSFKDGKMVSSACVNLGFAGFPYKATKKGDMIEFEASASNPKEGTLSWKGTVSGDTLNATSVWTRPGQAPDESWVKAKAQK